MKEGEGGELPSGRVTAVGPTATCVLSCCCCRCWWPWRRVGACCCQLWTACHTLLCGPLPVYRHLLALYVLTFLLVLPICCRHLNNSVYARHGANATLPAQRAMRQENSERLRQAQAFFQHLNHTKMAELLHSYARTQPSHLDVAITIITTSRKSTNAYEPRYLSQVVWRLLTLLQEQQHSGGYPLHLRLSLCNVDPHPELYTEAQSLHGLLPIVNRYSPHHPPEPNVHRLEKEKRDYVFCLNSSVSSQGHSSDYVFMLEDDALPTEDFLTVLHHVIQLHLQTHYARGQLLQPTPGDSPPAFVKFYHPLHLVSYIALDCERLPELLGFSVLVGTVLILLYWGPHRVLSHGYPATSWPVNQSWVLAVLYAGLVALAVGRVNIQELRRVWSPHLYSFTPAPSCCTPAILYPRIGAMRVINHLSAVTCGKNYGKDSALDDFRQNTSSKAYLVQPNLFTHIGMYSSLRKHLVDPFVV